MGAFDVSSIDSTRNNVASGAFSVCLYPYGAGKKRYLLLDDYVLCNFNTHSSPALSSLNKADLWIRFLEKVFVKLQSSYASLDGYYKFNSLYRHPARAMQLITGSPIALEVHYKPHQIDEVYDILLATEGKCCRVAHGRKATDGLHRGHGYSLLWIGEISGIQLVCVRNPHGKNSYTGEFGRGSSSWSTTDAVSVRRELDTVSSLAYVHNLLSGSHDNGIFLMRFSVFVECFPIVSVVGPIIDKDEPSASHLNGFVVKNCLHKLCGENITHLREMLKIAAVPF